MAAHSTDLDPATKEKRHSGRVFYPDNFHHEKWRSRILFGQILTGVLWIRGYWSITPCNRAYLLDKLCQIGEIPALALSRLEC